MQMLATIFSAILAGLGAMAIFWPEAVIGIGRSLSTPRGLLAVAAVRVVFGGLLLLASGLSRAPNLLRVFGALILVAGLATPLVGVELARNLLDAAARDGAWVRAAGTIAVALGVAFIWALSPRVHTPRRE